MLLNLVVLLVVLAIAAVSFWFAFKLFRKAGPLAKSLGGIGLALVGVLASVIAILGGMGMWTVYAPRGNPVRDVTVAGTAEQIARGQQITSTLCVGCHTVNDELPLSGGNDLFATIPIPLGSATPPNLTPAGRIDDWTDGQLERAIREGTYPNGHRMPIMSSQTFRYFSQGDLDSIVAYLRSQPPTPNDIPQKHTLNYLAMVITPLGMLPLKDQPDSNVPPAAVAKGPTAEYGEYIVKYTDCALCHGETFDGGTSKIAPQGPSLKVVKAWSVDQFITTLNTGVDPDGKHLDPDEMPWKEIGRLDDESITAIYEYLSSL